MFYKKLFFIETQPEATCVLELLRSPEFKTEDVFFISSSPDLRICLTDAGVNVFSTVDFDSLADHEEGGNLVTAFINSLNHAFKKAPIRDQFGVTESYRISIQWRLQYFAAHLIQLTQLYCNILEKNSEIDTIYCITSQSPRQISSLLDKAETYHVDIIHLVAKKYGKKTIEVGQYITPADAIKKTLPRNYFSSISYRILRWLIYRVIKNLGKKVILITATVNKLDVLVTKIQSRTQKTNFVLLNEIDFLKNEQSYSYLTCCIYSLRAIAVRLVQIAHLMIPLKNKELRINGYIDFRSLFICEYYLEKSQNPTIPLSFKSSLRNLSLSTRGIDLSNFIFQKFEHGIYPLIERSLVATRLLDTILAMTNPTGILTPHSLDMKASLGELARKKGIKAILISHGSHPIPSNEKIDAEYKRHGEVLIDTTYPYVAIQSELAARYCDYYNISSKRIMTGPLCWGLLDKKDPHILQKIGIPPGKKVIVHAGTQKGRSSHYFYRYETADEYLEALSDLIIAVKGMSDVALLIKFRNSETISFDLLKRILPKSDNVFFNKDASFLQIIDEADILVSFSSTTIEEALEFDTPVLQYGGKGRLAFIPSIELSENTTFKRSPAYFVSHKNALPKAIREILTEFEAKPLQPHELSDYVLPKSKLINIEDLFC